MSEKAQQCLKWIKQKYDIDFNDRFDIIDLVFEWEESLKNQSEQLIASQITSNDFQENLNKILKWYYPPNQIQKSKDRKLKQGDVIVYESSNNFNIMIIKSFDFASDFAARAYFGRNYGDFAPGIHKFRFATDEEIRNFLKQCVSNETNRRIYFNKESKYTPKYIIDLLNKYNI